MNQPEISIAVPVFKGVRFLASALESVLAQSFGGWECICVDDGSQDGSAAIAEGFASRDSRFRVLHRANGGTSAARNAALADARGRYIAFLDEDDVYHPRYLETLRSAAERHGADAVGMDFVPFDEGGAPDFREPPGEDAERAYDADGLRELASGWYDGAPWEVWRHLYRREAVEGVEFPVGVRVEQDLRWHYSVLPRFRKYVRIGWAGYGWRRNSNGGVLNPRPESLVSEAQAFRHFAEALPREMGLDGRQADLLRRNVAAWCKAALCAPVRRGVRFSRAESAAFRAEVRALREAGVDVRRSLGTRKRLLWNLFMATGIEGFTRI